MTPDPDELGMLRQRLAKLRHLHADKTAIAEAAGALLVQERTFPRPRREVERELQTAVQFDIPMLQVEIDKTERGIAALERTLGIAPAGEANTEAASEEVTAKSRCAAIAESLTALRSRAVYARELAVSSQAETLDIASLAAERERAERGVAEIEAGLAGVEPCIAAADADLREIVMQRAPNHERTIETGAMMPEAL